MDSKLLELQEVSEIAAQYNEGKPCQNEANKLAPITAGFLSGVGGGHPMYLDF